jgi:hypothetical protein
MSTRPPKRSVRIRTVLAASLPNVSPTIDMIRVGTTAHHGHGHRRGAHHTEARARERIVETQRRVGLDVPAGQLRELLIRVRASETCQRRDLADPITLLIATGLGARNCSRRVGPTSIRPRAPSRCAAKVVRQSGKGLFRVDETKRAATPTTSPGSGAKRAASWACRTSARTASASRWHH